MIFRRKPRIATDVPAYRDTEPHMWLPGTFYVTEMLKRNLPMNGEQMSTPKTIVIDGTEYIRKQDVSAGPPTPHRIVVADRGWVFVGATSTDDDGSLTITDAKVIRYWGTDEKRPGLGYLAANGPTEKTKLEPSGIVRVPAHSVISTFDVTYTGAWL